VEESAGVPRGWHVFLCLDVCHAPFSLVLVSVAALHSGTALIAVVALVGVALVVVALSVAAREHVAAGLIAVLIALHSFFCSCGVCCLLSSPAPLRSFSFSRLETEMCE
jgi:hypothetical protein